MAEAFYPPTPATDGATMNPVPGAAFQVFEIADTTFSTPLSLRVGSGNPTTTVTTSETLATLPGVYVTSPNVEHVWKSGSFEWRRDSIDGAKRAVEEAKVSASNSAGSAATSASDAATSAQAARDAAALVDAPADAAVTALINDSATQTRGALNSAITNEAGSTKDTNYTSKIVPTTGKGGLFVRSEQPKYAVKVDHYDVNGVHDAVNIAALFGGAHTPFSVNSGNTTLSTVKIVNSAVQTGGAIIAGVGDNTTRTAAVFGADNSGTGPSYLSTMKGGDGIAFRAAYETGTYTNSILWATGNHTGGNLFNIENAGAQTSGTMFKLTQSNASSTAPIISVSNSGTGVTIAAPSFNVLKDGRVQVTQLEGHSSFSHGTIRMQSTGVFVERSANDANPTLKIQNTSSTGTGDLAQFVKIGGEVSTRINKNGAFITKVRTAPADADLQVNELSLWFDAAAGALKIKAKDSAGVVKNGTVTLA